MKPEKPYYILGSKAKRPESKCTLFVDGTADKNFKEGIDQELSHWIPNRTQAQYKAGTSTESCYKFLDANKSLPYDLVINNHLDIDGLLSVFVLAYPNFALKHRADICKAAKAGDFWAWSEGKALHLFQELTLLNQKLSKDKKDLQKAFEECFALLLKILEEPTQTSNAHSILNHQFELVKDDKIKRAVLTNRFASYFVPQSLTQDKLETFLVIPGFNEPITEGLSFWPQVRNSIDEEKIQLVGIESENGVYYDLWYPGYVWADTESLWRPNGLILPEKMEDAYRIDRPDVSKAIAELNAIETGPCIWTLYSSIYLFAQKNHRGFPVFASTQGHEKGRGTSHLSIERVNQILSQVF